MKVLGEPRTSRPKLCLSWRPTTHRSDQMTRRLHTARPTTLVTALAAGVALVLVVTLVDPRSGLAQSVGNLGILVAVVTACASCVLAARRGGPAARAWTAFAVSTGLWAIGQAMYTAFGITRSHVYPFPSWADLFFLSYVVPAAVGLLLLPRGQQRQGARLRLVLDALLIALSVLLVSWAVVLGDLIDVTSTDLGSVVSISYPAIDLVLASLVLVLGLRVGNRARGTWVVLGLGLLALALTDTAYVSMLAHGETALTGTWLATGWMIGMALVAVAAHSDQPALDESSGAHFSVLQELLPYLPFAIALAMGLAQSSDDAFLAGLGAAVLAVFLVQQVAVAVEKVALTVGLEDRVTARTREVEASRAEAVAATNAKGDFLATMSHEIRTPMNGVIGLTDLLLHTELDEDQRLYTSGIRGAGEALLAIIDDILDFSKLDADKAELEVMDFDPAMLVEEVGSLLAVAAAGKDIELIAFAEPGIPTPLHGDPRRIRQALLNLAGNALKFTHDGQVVITAFAVPSPDPLSTLLRFEVQDTGIGISTEDQARLFQPFSQADASTTRRFGGTGLGLAISKRLVELMGGDFGLVSEVGAGSTFWFTVPLSAPAGGQAEPQPHPGALSGRRVLVVDDNQTNRLVVSAQVAGWGLRADVAATAAAALQMMREAAAEDDPYWAVLLDMRMPDVDGLGLARQIAADPTLAGTLKVMLSSVGLLLDTTTAPLLDAHLTKPVRASELFAALMRLALPDTSTPAPTVRAASPGTKGTNGGRRGRILVAEDHEINRIVAEGLLTRLGYDSVMVNDGEQALRALAAEPFDAVLMDCHMPVLDGYAATVALRERERGGARTPVIAMTAGVLKDERARCMQVGMDDFVPKPVDPEALGRVLAHWTRGALADRQVVDEHPVDSAVLQSSRVAVLRALGPDDGWGVFPAASEAFLDDVPGLLQGMRAALRQDDTTSMGELAHRLRGGAGNLGADRVALACSALEQVVPGDTPAADLTAALARLEDEVRLAADAIGRVLAGRSVP
ncbi:response regulator [Knoellia locipacati]|uniref:hybrid sensor histidine kinase/response regulator n=1 Tax=Knoellia locipacati TaxID=882824 RepID=UPI00384B49E3